MQLVLAVVVLVAVHVDVSFGFGTGAPQKACTDMTPGHGTEQTGANSHTVTLPSGVTTYTPGATIKVKVTGTFKGVLLQARKADGSNTTPYGTWKTTVTDTKATKCTADDDAITHSKDTDKTDAEFTWTPPSEDVGTLKFVATVAEEKVVWWKNTDSASVTYKASDTGAGVKEVASATVLAAAFMLQYVL